MSARKNIFLIGFMGTGKSAVSDKLARRLGLRRIEADEEIVRREGMSISDIFDKKGEAYFRDVESALLAEVSCGRGAVVSCGGGAVLRDENVAAMKSGGTLVLLTARPETVLKRVGSGDSRPVLRGNVNEEFIQKKMEERRALYENAADFSVATDDRRVDEICGEIIKNLGGVIVRGCAVGFGRPKICVSVVGKTEEEVLSSARAASASSADIVEWRADYFGSEDEAAVGRMLSKIRGEIGNVPLIFTFRTKREGGEKEIEFGKYSHLCCAAAEGAADIVDIEAFWENDNVEKIVSCVSQLGKKTILSHHNFSLTPNENEIISRLEKMRDLGADIAKIAVMPNCEDDVETLLSVTEKADSENGMPPLITISMGALGRRSRLGISASAATFGALGASASAPGQVDTEELKKILEGEM